MDNISPLAKTLAEANGIDWKQLQGTGEGGQIVEQDIINYLTRLMTGDEAIPENPVDAPPPDWQGDELPAGMNAEMLSQAGVESDIAQAVAQGGFKPERPQSAATPTPTEPEPEPAQEAPAEQPTEQIAEDEFELEPEAITPQPAAPEPAQPAQPEPEQPEPEPVEEPTQPEPEPVQPDAAPEPQPQAAAEAEQPAAAPEIAPEPTTEPVVPAPEPVTPEPQQPAADIPAEPTPPAVPAAVPAMPAEQVGPDRPVVVAATGGERPAEAVWLGVYLRRDTDLSAASDLRKQLNAALGQDVPLSLLVARAAQQHIDKLGLNSVAIHDAYGDRARSIGPANSGLREALGAIDSDHQGEPDLQVVNAGTFDLDELHYPETITLSIGRLSENGMAALTLNGNIETTQAAEFLAAVSDSLEAPVALII